jgi:phage tail-like protein
MARSSENDPIEKFRFRVTVISIDLSLTGALDTASSLISNAAGINNPFGVITRSGFSEVTLPKANVGEINYRENIDNLRFSKIPGLVKYEPVTLRRGVTSNRNLYDWYRLVNDEIALLSVSQELTRDAKLSVVQSENFRKDVIIEVLDRVGNPTKAWYLFNAWPNSYKPGNDLNAGADEKLVEELSLTYEFFLELEGGPGGFAKEIAKGALEGVAGAALNFVQSNLKLPFSR